jgi:hypothetical protein
MKILRYLRLARWVPGEPKLERACLLLPFRAGRCSLRQQSGSSAKPGGLMRRARGRDCTRIISATEPNNRLRAWSGAGRFRLETRPWRVLRLRERMMRSGSQVLPLRATLHDRAMTAVPHRAVVSCDYSRSYKGGVLMSVHNCTFSAVVEKMPDCVAPRHDRSICRGAAIEGCPCSLGDKPYDAESWVVEGLPTCSWPPERCHDSYLTGQLESS